MSGSRPSPATSARPQAARAPGSVLVAGAESGACARSRGRPLEVDPSHARVRMGGAKDGGVEHPRQLEIGGVPGLASGAQRTGYSPRRTADDLERAGGPLLERVLLDAEPEVFVAAFDLLLRPDQPCHVAIASS